MFPFPSKDPALAFLAKNVGGDLSLIGNGVLTKFEANRKSGTLMTANHVYERVLELAPVEVHFPNNNPPTHYVISGEKMTSPTKDMDVALLVIESPAEQSLGENLLQLTYRSMSILPLMAK